MKIYLIVALVLVSGFGARTAAAQPLGQPDRGEPGDQMIQDYLARTAARIQDSFTGDLKSLDSWRQNRERHVEEYYYMLGLSPRPELYVTGNLYRPSNAKSGEKLPAVFYVCGHSGRGRDGNKTAFQSHGMWFARHGYVCLVVDTLQLGEIAATHHGTYNQNRWWWHSRGYTSAGVECWNGVRGIDYLVSRPDVDPERIAVTGISGGGAATFWIAAADERVKVAVPVSGMADLVSYVPNRVINGHCDCMFLYNTFEWPWTRIAGLVAPRPMLFVNSDNDGIFPMDANDRVINQLERLYSLFGAGDRVDAVVSVGGHAYRKDILDATYRFINTHLKQDAKPVSDSEVDLVIDIPGKQSHPIEPQKLRVFPTDRDIPADQLNTTIDQHFVPMADVKVPSSREFQIWKLALQAELRRVAFRTLPEPIPAGKMEAVQESPVAGRLVTEEGIFVRLERMPKSSDPKRIVLYVQNSGKQDSVPTWVEKVRQPGEGLYRCEPRGIGDTRWTVKNPPNYVARSHVLLGSTVDTGRVHDVLATVRYLRTIHNDVPVVVAGEGPAAIIAAYAALWDPEIAGVIAHNPPATHMDPAAPQFLNILRVADIADTLGLLAPRQLTIASDDARFQKTAAIYKAAGAEDKISLEK
ncbi:MAG: prolyl oligopeptidase family serine peptidase [Planctomycetia bacterium]|nr:prolyl oligopeptidase family serine peptidase [Planctomycetia bacterium]